MPGDIGKRSETLAGEWRGLWLSSWVLSLSLFGDALIYIVLPVNVELFGISLAWVGVLLAANRIIRTFIYGWVALLGEWIGLKPLCIMAYCTAAVSTAGYGLLEGGYSLLGSRMLWGVSYASLLVVSLAYAARDRTRTGTRIGISRAVEQVGPLLSMTVGAWLAGVVGAKDVFVYLSLATICGLPLTFLLPASANERPRSFTTARPAMFPKPDRFDFLIFWMGAGIDGVFTLTVTIMLADHVSIEWAMVGGGLILAVRRISEMLIAPVSGAIADRFGVRLPLVTASLAAIVGFTLIGLGSLIAGSIAIVVARGALGTLFPAAVANFTPNNVLQSLARNQTWRDMGAALGPLATGFLFDVISAETLHLAVAVIYAASLFWLMVSPVWRPDRV